MDESLRHLIARARAGFASGFGVSASAAAIAPGRVNIIGEHVDYGGGVVVPFAIDRWCVAVAAPGRHGDAWRVMALDLDEAWELPKGVDLGPAAVATGSWQAYVVGMLALARDALAARGVALEPMSIAITSNLPRGSGLSSSAALTVAVAKAVEGVVTRVGGAAIDADGLELARLCQRAEREFAGVPCGLMDHAASVLGHDGRAVVLTCREPETYEYVCVPDGIAWLVVESGVSRSLAAGKYAGLREASDEAARVLGVRWLWDAREVELDAFAQKLSVAARRAAMHAIGERGRVERVLAACERGDVDGVKQEMNAGHASLRDVLGVSCRELDAIVESAQRQDAGARLVGAGFGGCALIAIEAARADEVTGAIRVDFEHEFGRVCPVWRVTPSGGARGVTE